MAKLHQIIVYLDEDLAGSVRAAARQRRTSASAYAKAVLERELTTTRRQAPDPENLLAAILIGVDALVKHHPNEKLFGVVKATRSAKLGAPSDEA
jgi:hypothetical protein